MSNVISFFSSLASLSSSRSFRRSGKFQTELGQLACVDCGIGKAATDVARNRPCEACLPGRHQPKNGTTSCLECIPGRYQNLNEQIECVACAVGQASSVVARGSACVSCSAGRFQPLAGATTCNLCIPGQFEAERGNINCTSCPLNTYSDTAQQTRCKSCPVGTFTNGPGAAACIKCGAGRYGIGCKNCPVGWYRHELFNVSGCVLCQIGYTTAGPGATSCDGCDAGTYGNRPGKCVACPTGYFQEAKANTHCDQCEPATLFINVRTECFGCSLGFYGSATGPGVCDRCLSGRYQDAKGSLQCKPCPIDTFFEKVGATALSQCTACSQDRTTGTIVGSQSNDACVCKKYDYYHDKDDSRSTCLPCIVGAVCPFDGTKRAQIYAKPGFWLPENVTTEVVDCGEAFADLKLKDLARTLTRPGWS